jgi:hypothetical protein
LEEWKDIISQQRVLLFIDNYGAQDCLVKGSASVDTWRQLLLKLGEIDDSLFANMWVTRVASSSNPADFPSRGSLHLCPYAKVERGRTAMQLLSQSVEMQCKMPTNANNMRKM